MTHVSPQERFHQNSHQAYLQRIFIPHALFRCSKLPVQSLSSARGQICYNTHRAIKSLCASGWRTFMSPFGPAWAAPAPWDAPTNIGLSYSWVQSTNVPWVTLIYFFFAWMFRKDMFWIHVGFFGGGRCLGAVSCCGICTMARLVCLH